MLGWHSSLEKESPGCARFMMNFWFLRMPRPQAYIHTKMAWKRNQNSVYSGIERRCFTTKDSTSYTESLMAGDHKFTWFFRNKSTLTSKDSMALPYRIMPVSYWTSGVCQSVVPRGADTVSGLLLLTQSLLSSQQGSISHCEFKSLWPVQFLHSIMENSGL